MSAFDIQFPVKFQVFGISSSLVWFQSQYSGVNLPLFELHNITSVELFLSDVTLYSSLAKEGIVHGSNVTKIISGSRKCGVLPGQVVPSATKYEIYLDTKAIVFHHTPSSTTFRAWSFVLEYQDHICVWNPQQDG
jgi:hypothetical protein